MRFRARLLASCLGASLALLATSTPVAARPSPITGALSKPGYTVIALAADGRATSVHARTGVFSLRPRAGTVTLHLRGRDGVYAGPIVVGRVARRAVMGVRAGARLGKVSVRNGYAKLARRVPRKWLDRRRVARARGGVPIGARRFGRVRSRHRHGGVPGDSDLDGVADPLDVDDDGDLVLDNLDRTRAARVSQLDPGRLIINSDLELGLSRTVNANAGALTSEQVDAALASAGGLKLTGVLGDAMELDCRGLVYCTSGGTGRVLSLALPPFPDCCDPDGDGFGTWQGQAKHANTMGLHHGATTSQIGTGDVLIERVTTAGVETQFPAAVQYVFATVPALVSYDDGRGHSASIPYPFISTPQNPEVLPVAARPNGDVIVTLTFWRPQRRPIPPETGDWIDIGRLDYSVGVGETESSCPKRAFSESDPNLTRVGFPATPGTDLGGLMDSAPDRPASPANTFTYTLNLTECLASMGIPFNPGETRPFLFGGSTPAGAEPGGGGAGQPIVFKRQ